MHHALKHEPVLDSRSACYIHYSHALYALSNTCYLQRIIQKKQKTYSNFAYNDIDTLFVAPIKP